MVRKYYEKNIIETETAELWYIYFVDIISYFNCQDLKTQKLHHVMLNKDSASITTF